MIMKRQINAGTLVFPLLVWLLMTVTGCDTKDTIDPTYDDFFIKYYGNEGDQTGKGTLVAADGILIAGTTTLEGGVDQIYLVKTDFNGNMVWDRRFTSVTDPLEVVGIVRDQSGSLYIAANRLHGDDLRDFYVMKTDANGGFLSDATFSVDDSGIAYNDQLESITINAQDQIILTGWSANVNDKELPSNISDVYSLVLTPDLVPLSDTDWRKVSGFRESMDLGKKIIQAKDGGRYFFIGTTNKSDGTGLTAQTNLISFPLQNDGQFPVGDVINGTTFIETASDIIPTSGGDVVAMWNSSTGFNSSTIYLAYANEEQNYKLQSGQALPFNSAVGKSIIQSRFGGYILLGEQINNNNKDIFLIRTDQNFEVIWQVALGGLEDEEASQIAELEDGSVVIAGTVVLESQSKMFLIKTKPNGELKP